MGRPRRIDAFLLALAPALVLPACVDSGDSPDVDHDGVEDARDCAPADAGVHPGALDDWGDGIDQDCDGADGIDRDHDGYPSNPGLEFADNYDCNDSSPIVHPGAVELPNDGVDNDCDGLELVDQDHDGHGAGLDDCDDADPLVWAGAPEQPDGRDQDCDTIVDEGTEARDDDADGSCEGWHLDSDGVPDCSDGTVPGDCDDGDAARNLRDDDGDGATTCGGDCDDLEERAFPGAVEACDGIDDDCDGALPASEADADGDLARPCDGDCDDAEPTVHPGAAELCNGKDDDCLGSTQEALDADGDGFAVCDGDCDDGEPLVAPGMAETCDGLDNDCDGPPDDACDDCTLTVPEDVATVQAALDAAADGDLVCLAPGTWFGQVDFLGRQVHLLGLGGRDVTFLDGAGSGPVVTMASGEGTGAVLEGVTVQNGIAEDGGGVRIDGLSAPTLLDVRVTANHAASDGGGIWIGGTSTPLLEGCLLDGNTADGNGGGLAADAALLDAVDTGFEGNVALGEGGGLYLASAMADLLRIDLAGNASVASSGGGLYGGNSSISVLQSVIRENTAYFNGGGLRVWYSDLDMVDVLVVGNFAQRAQTWADYPQAGGGVNLTGAAATFVRVVFAQNSTPGKGGALRSYQSDAFVSQSVFVGNYAAEGGGAVSQDSSQTQLVACAFADNASPWGGVLRGGVTPTSCSFSGPAPLFYDATDPTGTDGNIAADPQFLDVLSPDPLLWDYHLAPGSPLVGAGPAVYLDPDGSPSDLGIYGGPGADGWDLDGDGFPAWFHPGPYDPLVDPALGFDCQDQDASVFPGSGC